MNMTLDDYIITFMKSEGQYRKEWFRKQFIRCTSMVGQEYVETYNEDPDADFENYFYIIKGVSRTLRMPIKLIQSRKRHQEIVRARHLCSYFLREKTTITLHEVGMLLNRDHSNIVTSVKRVKACIGFPKGYPQMYSEYMACLNFFEVSNREQGEE